MKRYPGIRPFRTDEQAIFYGRDLDIDRLHRLIELEQLVILYGKSGYGKSSLLSAGIFPRLKAAGKRQFWEIRFGPYKAGESRPPAEYVRQAITRNSAAQPLVPDALADACIWQAFKNRQQGENAAFLLVFDQFEELFSYPQEQILAFKKQLAEALYSKVPKRFEAALADAGLSPEQEDAVYTPFELKVVFSIRSDRMSQLNVLKDYLPNLLQNGYELDALDEAGARDAILRPAGLNPTPIPSPKGEGGLPSNKKLISEGMETSLVEEEENQASDNISNSGAMKPPSPLGEGLGVGLTTDEAFDTPPFTYSSDALNAIFTALSDDRGRIETSTLQIICRYVEDNLVGTEGADIRIEADDLGNIKAIFRQFYERTIARLPEAEQIPARRLVEDRLIKDGVRIPYAAQALLAEPDITQELLDALSAASLLRVQRDEQGRMLYEVGHDTLVAPITEAAQVRRAEEEKLRLQQEADEQRREKEKAVVARRRARMVAVGAIVLSLVAIAASLFAWQQTIKAGEEAENARQKQMLADSSARVAEAQRTLAVKKQAEADSSAALALRREAQAQAAEQRASNALRQANGNAVVAVEVLLKQAKNSVYHMDYGEARTSLEAAAKLGQQKRAVAKGLYELAFFFTECDSLSPVQGILPITAALLGKQIATKRNAGDQRTVLEKSEPNWYQEMLERYFPVMANIAGGEFIMGCIKPEDYCAENPTPYRVRLSNYQLASTETTFWQWGLYCASKRLQLRDFSPSWGIDGDNPAVNVDWFHATEYANWLSARFGKPPVYQIDSLDKRSRGNWEVSIIPETLEKGGFRLPTEAEWEYAARGGPNQYPYSYAGSDVVSEVAWYNRNSDMLGVQRTRPVATRKPLNLSPNDRLYDMTGNVWEWCWDWCSQYRPDTTGPVLNPYGRPKGDRRVLRGGSWDFVDNFILVANRDDYVIPGGRIYSDEGFRLARH